LRRDKDGTAWRYAAAMTRDGWARVVASALAARIVDGGDVGLAAFIDAAADGQVLDRLAALIEQRRR
jgi:hypothetical protein